MEEFVSGIVVGAMVMLFLVIAWSSTPFFKHDVGWEQPACIYFDAGLHCATGREIAAWMRAARR